MRCRRVPVGPSPGRIALPLTISGGGQRPWDRLQPDAAAIASLDALRAEGADWFGMTRDTTDSAQRRLLDHNPGLIDHLDRVGERVVDDERVLIWRLSGAAEPD